MYSEYNTIDKKRPSEHTRYVCAVARVLFKRLGSRHIHKEIKLQKTLNGMDKILCKTDFILIRKLT